ncbi:hypothetical protein ATANTOWER_017580 [Ataeniobius toweri]|uniref:Uncharacterized protein n=1 Tax=Ataeniobius toweri TaxID=208326 RepID=A0ABU7C255_9TELE|nr:hypothetical protein [Ataeniobius toweri]
MPSHIIRLQQVSEYCSQGEKSTKETTLHQTAQEGWIPHAVLQGTGGQHPYIYHCYGTATLHKQTGTPSRQLKKILRTDLPSTDSQRAIHIIKDSFHPAHFLFKHKHTKYYLRSRADNIITQKNKFYTSFLPATVGLIANLNSAQYTLNNMNTRGQ